MFYLSEFLKYQTTFQNYEWSCVSPASQNDKFIHTFFSNGLIFTDCVSRFWLLASVVRRYFPKPVAEGRVAELLKRYRTPKPKSVRNCDLHVQRRGCAKPKPGPGPNRGRGLRDHVSSTLGSGIVFSSDPRRTDERDPVHGRVQRGLLRYDR